MSTFMTLKEELDAVEAQHQAAVEVLKQRMAEARAAEREQEVAKCKQVIAAFDIQAGELFTGLAAVAKRERKHKPITHAWKGDTWRGFNGVKPGWYTKALADGVTDEQMRAEARKLTQ